MKMSYLFLLFSLVDISCREKLQDYCAQSTHTLAITHKQIHFPSSPPPPTTTNTSLFFLASVTCNTEGVFLIILADFKYDHSYRIDLIISLCFTVGILGMSGDEEICETELNMPKMERKM
jgi:hypothetical protein